MLLLSKKKESLIFMENFVCVCFLIDVFINSATLNVCMQFTMHFHLSHGRLMQIFKWLNSYSSFSCQLLCFACFHESDTLPMTTRGVSREQVLSFARFHCNSNNILIFYPVFHTTTTNSLIFATKHIDKTYRRSTNLSYLHTFNNFIEFVFFFFASVEWITRDFTAKKKFNNSF